MRPTEQVHNISLDEISRSEAERLVSYEEAKAKGSGVHGEGFTKDESRADLKCIDLLHRVWPDPAEPSSRSENPPPRTLGDFRLLREIGRGGMGTVFEAEQISMGRHVALKTLPFAALTRENSLQRFRNEVRAAAALDHPNIVSVYSIGEERGVHFYAMQLIRGQTLADMIGELREKRRIAADSESPTIDSSVMASPSTKRDAQSRISTAADSRRDAESYRVAARLGIQAAEALQHAHDQGVLHRDIKPSNLMLDREGKLYVTDFGLARIEADAGMTMTGDIVGTLRYMAPEQALAKRVVMDHRADIYSLGATMYELLTLQPAFGETDRSELLKQIAFEEPLPLRKIDRRLPFELETIVLKAMAKNPDERYQSTQQLADDLRAFIENRPISAKPPTLLDRANKWSRRHVGLVRAAIASLLVVLALSSVSVVIVTQLYHEANAQRYTAVGAAARAERERQRTELLLATMQLQNGTKLLDQEQPSGLLDLVEARHTAGDQPVGRSAARLWAAANDNLKVRLVHVIPSSEYLQFSPDGTHFATARKDSVSLRDIETGRRLFGPLKLDANVNTVVYSPDGALVAAHSWIGVSQVWNAKTGEAVSPVLRHPKTPVTTSNPSNIAAFSPDGELLATGGADRLIRIWQVGSWKPYCEPLQHGGAVMRLAFEPDGKRIVSLASDNVLHMWNIAEGKVHSQNIPAFNMRNGGPLALSPQCKWIFHKRRDQAPVITDAATFQVHAPLKYDKSLVTAVFSPDETLLATGASDWTVRLWDTSTGQQVGNVMNHASRSLAVRFSHKGNLMASGSKDQTVVIWDTATQRRVSPPLYFAGEVTGIEFSPDDTYLAAVGFGTARLWKIVTDLTSPHPQIVPRSERATPSAVSPNGKYLATIAVNGGVALSDKSKPDASPVILKRDFMRCVAFNSDSKLLATGADDWRIRIWECLTGRLIKTIDAQERVYGIAFSPIEPNTLATAQFDGTARLWNVATSQAIGIPMKHDAPVWEVAFDPKSEMIATASGRTYLRPDRIRLWDIKTDAPYPSITLPFRPMSASMKQWSASSTFATFDKDRTMVVRDLISDGALKWRLPEPPTDAYSMRNETWLALGIRRTLLGTTEAMTSSEWRELRHNTRGDAQFRQ